MNGGKSARIHIPPILDEVQVPGANYPEKRTKSIDDLLGGGRRT